MHTYVVVFYVLITCSLVGEHQCFTVILLSPFSRLFYFITEKGHVVNITTVCVDVSDTLITSEQVCQSSQT
jgi:hypothetical protein